MTVLANAAVGLAGVALLVVATVDFVWTTLAIHSGSGPLTRFVSRVAWRLTLRGGRRWRRVLIAGGVVTVVTPLLVWVALVWVGWALVLSASPGAVVTSAGGASAGWVDRVYFAGYSVFTLGNGEFRPGSGWWQLATVLMTVHGLTLLSMGIAYMVLVVSAAEERRELAVTIAGLGTTPEGILTRAWTGQDFGRLPLRLERLAPQVVQLAERHSAYPVIHFFHSGEATSSAPVMVATLADAVLLLDEGVEPRVRPGYDELAEIRWALERFAGVLGAHYAHPVGKVPSPPSRTVLGEVGIPLTAEDVFTAAMDRTAPTRVMWAEVMAGAGWV